MDANFNINNETNKVRLTVLLDSDEDEKNYEFEIPCPACGKKSLIFLNKEQKKIKCSNCDKEFENIEDCFANDDEDYIKTETKKILSLDGCYYQCGACDKDLKLLYIKNLNKFLCADCLSIEESFKCGVCGETLPKNKYYFGAENAGQNNPNSENLEYKTVCCECLDDKKNNLVDKEKKGEH